MLPYRSSALLASAALVVGAALVPASAFADDPTPTPDPAISNADLVAALTAAETPTAAAAKAGWLAQGGDANSDFGNSTIKAIYAVNLGSADAGADGSMVEAEHSGTYMTLSSLGAHRFVKRSLKAIKRPHATWIFLRDRSLDLRDPDGDSMVAQLAPDLLLKELVDPKHTTLVGTPTVKTAADGSKTYTFAGADLDSEGVYETGTLMLNPSGVLTSVKTVSSSDTTTIGYSYGAQHVTLPSKKSTITFEQFNEGSILSNLPTEVKSAATELAKDATMEAKKRPHKHTVKVEAIRTYAKRFAKLTNSLVGAKIFSTTSLPRGARITGTNPFTHAHVSYDVTAAGKKAVAHKA